MNCEGRAAHPPCGVGKLMGGGGSNRKSGREPNQGYEEKGGNRRVRRIPAVDQSRKEIADRVARHQADWEEEHACTTRATNWCNWV